MKIFGKYISLLLVLFCLGSCKGDIDFAGLERVFFEIESDSFGEIIFEEPIDSLGLKVVSVQEKRDSKNVLPGKTVTLVSWNILHLGRSKTDAEIHQIAQLLRNFDLVAIQEVVAKDPAGAQAVAKIADELNRMGFQWDYQVSDPTKSPSVYVSERYAFLWKPSRVTMIGRAKLDKDLEDLCFREPFVGKFRIRGDTTSFYVVNYHSRKYSDKPEEEIIHLLDYPERLNSSNVLIAGDFNTDEQNRVWKPFYAKGFKSAVQKTKTTLKHSCKSGDYRNHPIDNIYFTPGIQKIRADAIDFVKACDSLKKARGVSDHLPVYMEFGLN